MKRFLIIAVLCLSALTAKAQTIEVVLGEQPRIFLEKTSITDKSITFAYLEGSYGAGAMVKLFREQKWWDVPAYIHAEYQSTFNGSHTAIAGGTWSFGLPNGFISLSPLYRYDFGINRNAIQLSNAYLAAWKWCELYGYNHIWYNGGVNFFGEERLHINITSRFKIGVILNITYFGAFDTMLSFGLRYDL
jgi:hypothetical protein